MATIPQRELRNNVADVLRRAERGERITITISDRPVAELGPLSGGRPFAPAGRLAAILAEAPADPAWVADLERQREEDRAAAREPWDG